MKVTLLGTGTSSGVPVLGCNCEVCRSKDPRDNRLRCAALIETEKTRILIDAGPDIRQQLLRVPFRKIDGVLITHIHYDHVGEIWILNAEQDTVKIKDSLQASFCRLFLHLIS